MICIFEYASTEMMFIGYVNNYDKNCNLENIRKAALCDN